MQAHAREGVADVESPGTMAFIQEDEERQRLVWMMADYAQVVGAEGVQARAGGFRPPPVISGTVEDHRPDMVCRFSGDTPRVWIVEAVTRQALEDPHLPARWALFQSLGAQVNAELHFVVPRWTRDGDIGPRFRRRLLESGVRGHVWRV